MSAALSSDHDDDDGSADGHAADCTWCWGRIGIAPTAWIGGRGRADCFADADPLYYAGDLSLHGTVPAVDSPAFAASACEGFGGCGVRLITLSWHSNCKSPALPGRRESSDAPYLLAIANC